VYQTSVYQSAPNVPKFNDAYDPILSVPNATGVPNVPTVPSVPKVTMNDTSVP